jgi:hypothetical protein
MYASSFDGNKVIILIAEEDMTVVVTFPTVKTEYANHFDQAMEAHYVSSNS